MSTSPGSSPPWDLNIAPLAAAAAAVTTQTHGGLLTPAAQKRLEADVSNQTSLWEMFSGLRMTRPQPRPAFPPSAARRFTAEDGRTARAGGQTEDEPGWSGSGQLVWGQIWPGHLPFPAPRPGPLGAAGHGPATCGQCETFSKIYFHFSTSAFFLYFVFMPAGFEKVG